MDSDASTKRVAAVILLVLFAGLVLACSSERDGPLLSPEELFTPTPLPSDTPVPTAAANETKPTDIFGFDYNGKVTLAQWDDPAIQMENFIVGYIIVHGMVYETELVEVAESEYAAALQSGDVDVVLEVGRTEPSPQFDWLLESGEVIDVGSLFGESSDVRIGARAQLKETAPPVFDLLTRVEADEEVLSGLASQIRGGRVGVSASVAGMMFLKRHEDVWTSWVSPETAANVKAAMEETKTSLHYKCLRVPGENAFYCK